MSLYTQPLFTPETREIMGFGDWIRRNIKWLALIATGLVVLFVPGLGGWLGGLIMTGASKVFSGVGKAGGWTAGAVKDMIKSGNISIYAKRDGSVGWFGKGKSGAVDLTVGDVPNNDIPEHKEARACYIATETYPYMRPPTAFYVFKNLLPFFIVNFYYKNFSNFVNWKSPLKNMIKCITIPFQEIIRVLYR